MTRQDLRNRHPYHKAAFHAVEHQSGSAATTKPYNRHSLRHRMLAVWARVRLAIGR